MMVLLRDTIKKGKIPLSDGGEKRVIPLLLIIIY